MAGCIVTPEELLAGQEVDLLREVALGRNPPLPSWMMSRCTSRQCKMGFSVAQDRAYAPRTSARALRGPDVRKEMSPGSCFRAG